MWANKTIETRFVYWAILSLIIGLLVAGEDEYYWFHDYGLENCNMCFGDKENVDNEGMQVATVLNEEGEKVKAEINTQPDH
eukprot:scaffold229468_cov36-Cyclotella_meneghiniana.AAC.3